MSEITRVPLQPVAKGSLAKVWLGVIVAVLVGIALAWTMRPVHYSEVKVVALKDGNGKSPTTADVALVNYVGRLASTGKIVHLFPIHLQGGIDRSRLHLPADELRQDRDQFALADAPIVPRGHRAVSILCIRLHTKRTLKYILLVLIDEDVKKLCRSSEANRQYASSGGIERTQMPRVLFAVDLSNIEHDIA